MSNHSYQTVIDAINAILGDTSQTAYTIPVIDRLVSFGFIPTTADAIEIAFSMQKAYQHVLNATNQSKVPDGLKYVLIDMMIGEFLNARYLTGRLNLSGLDLNGMVQSVSEGDTSVTFAADASDDAKCRSLIDWMRIGKGCDFICYRKLRW